MWNRKMRAAGFIGGLAVVFGLWRYRRTLMRVSLCGDKVIDVGVGKRSGAEVWVSPREIRDFLLGGRRASLVR